MATAIALRVADSCSYFFYALAALAFALLGPTETRGSLVQASSVTLVVRIADL